MKRKIILAVLLLVSALGYAETEEHRQQHPHQFSIGLGDSFMEAYYTLYLAHNIEKFPSYALPHIFFQYDYRINRTLSVGAFVDVMHCSDKGYSYEWVQGGQIIEHGAMYDHKYTNVSLVPTLNFTYIHRPKFSMHSGFGIGYMASFEDVFSEELPSPRHDIQHNLGLYLSAVGFTFGDEKIYCGIDIGGLTGFTGAKIVTPGIDGPDYVHYHFGSEWLFGRILSVSVGFRK